MKKTTLEPRPMPVATYEEFFRAAEEGSLGVTYLIEHIMWLEKRLRDAEEEIAQRAETEGSLTDWVNKLEDKLEQDQAKKKELNERATKAEAAVAHFTPLVGEHINCPPLDEYLALRAQLEQERTKAEYNHRITVAAGKAVLEGERKAHEKTKRHLKNYEQHVRKIVEKYGSIGTVEGAKEEVDAGIAETDFEGESRAATTKLLKGE